MSATLIHVGSDLPPTQAKLAFSAGLCRSVKLDSLESLLEAFLEKHEHIPAHLVQGRKLPLGREGVLRSLGELFALRGMVNLHSELLEAPDFMWSSAGMERCFTLVSRSLDVGARVAVFNRRLDYANETSEVLRSHLHEQHSIKLEIIIIVLIAVETGFELLHYLERWGIFTAG